MNSSNANSQKKVTQGSKSASLQLSLISSSALHIRKKFSASRAVVFANSPHLSKSVSNSLKIPSLSMPQRFKTVVFLLLHSVNLSDTSY